jgi:hypothetical protein
MAAASTHMTHSPEAGGACWRGRLAIPRAASKSAESQGSLMAVDPAGGHPAMDYPEHLRTYSGFLKATVILVVFCTGLLLFLLTLVP